MNPYGRGDNRPFLQSFLQGIIFTSLLISVICKLVWPKILMLESWGHPHWQEMKCPDPAPTIRTHRLIYSASKHCFASTSSLFWCLCLWWCQKICDIPVIITQYHLSQPHLIWESLLLCRYKESDHSFFSAHSVRKFVALQKNLLHFTQFWSRVSISVLAFDHELKSALWHEAFLPAPTLGRGLSDF